MLPQVGQVKNSENPEISEISEIFFEIFKSEFLILTVGKNRKRGNKKTQNNISEISEFSISYFFIFQKTFFFQYSTVGNSLLLIYVVFCFQSRLFFSFTKNIYSKYYLVVMRYICCEMYLYS